MNADGYDTRPCRDCGRHRLVKNGSALKCDNCGASTSLEFDAITKSAHYNQHPSGVECIEIVRHFSFNLGNVIKYIWREAYKTVPLEDLRKARYYLDDEIRRRECDAASAKREGKVAP